MEINQWKKTTSKLKTKVLLTDLGFLSKNKLYLYTKHGIQSETLYRSDTF